MFGFDDTHVDVSLLHEGVGGDPDLDADVRQFIWDKINTVKGYKYLLKKKKND